MLYVFTPVFVKAIFGTFTLNDSLSEQHAVEVRGVRSGEENQVPQKNLAKGASSGHTYLLLAYFAMTADADIVGEALMGFFAWGLPEVISHCTSTARTN